MVLTVDVGNTNIVLGCFEQDHLKLVSRIATDKSKMEDQYAIEISQILKFHNIDTKDFTGAIISSVVPPLLATLKKAIGRLLGCKVFTVSPGTKTGLNIKTDNPAILGADLVCGAVCALNKYPHPCIILDLGTATKFTVLDKDGGLIGVSIAPGVNISLEALSSKTAQLPFIDFDDNYDNHPVIGTDTISSMRSGIVLGTASMIDGMIKRINTQLKQDAFVVATGGIASCIIPYCESQIAIDDNLLLEGLYIIYKKNSTR